MSAGAKGFLAFLHEDPLKASGISVGDVESVSDGNRRSSVEMRGLKVGGDISLSEFLPPGIATPALAEIQVTKPFPALEEAIRQGKLHEVKKLVGQEPALAIIAVGETGMNLTELAATMYKLDILQFLCQKNYSSFYFREELHQWVGRWLAAQLWDSASVAMSVMNSYQRASYLLIWAASHPNQEDLAKYEELFCLMTEEHPTLDIYAVMSDKAGRTALHIASQMGNIPAVDILLGRPAVRREIDKTDREGLSPLGLAVKHEQYVAYQRLLNHGADFSKLFIDANDSSLLERLAQKVEQRGGAEQMARFNLMKDITQLLAPQGSSIIQKQASTHALVSPRSRSHDLTMQHRRLFKRMFTWADPQGIGRLNKDAIARLCSWMGFQLRSDEISFLLAEAGDPTSIDFPTFVGMFKDFMTVFGITEEQLPPLPPLEAQWAKSWLSGTDALSIDSPVAPVPENQPLRSILLECETGDQVFHVLSTRIFAELDPHCAGVLYKKNFRDYLNRKSPVPFTTTELEALDQAYANLLVRCDLPANGEQGISLSHFKIFLSENFIGFLEVVGRLIDFQISFTNIFGGPPAGAFTSLHSLLFLEELRHLHIDIQDTGSAILSTLFSQFVAESRPRRRSAPAIDQGHAEIVDPRDQLDQQIAQLQALSASLRKSDTLPLEKRIKLEKDLRTFTPAAQNLILSCSP